MAVTEVPHAVVKVLDSRPRQQPIGWPRARWLAGFPECDAVLAALPDRLDRPTVRAACREAASSPLAAWRAFVVVMAWGHGTVGYGPWRTVRILRDTSDAPERLASVAQQLAEPGGHGRLRAAGRGLPAAVAGTGVRDQVPVLLSPAGRAAGAHP